jgi:hypothetical protein
MRCDAEMMHSLKVPKRREEEEEEEEEGIPSSRMK